MSQASGPNGGHALQSKISDYLNRGLPLSIGDGSGVIKDLEEQLRFAVAHRRVLTTSSGTAALHSAFLSLDLPLGAEVIVGSLGFHASFTPAAHAGLSPVLVDVDPLTGNIDPESLREAITERTGAVVVTHLWGHPADMERIAETCRMNNLFLIEDCSHAYLSASANGVQVGQWGDIAVWSMQANKMLSAGEGGFLATDNERLYERCVLAGHYRGRSSSQVVSPDLNIFSETGMGLKYRLHPLAAVAALCGLETLESRVRNRQEAIGKINLLLNDSSVLEPQHVGPGIDMGGWFAFRPRVRSGNGQVENVLAAAKARGLALFQATPFRLDNLPLVASPFPQRALKSTWKPRIKGPLSGLQSYVDGRVSLRVDAALSEEGLMQIRRGFLDLERDLGQ